MAKKAPAVIVVGAGISGLCCAVTLHEAGIPVQVVEGSDRVGGRAASDRYDGFILDRGFHVLLTAYPEAKKFLDFGALNLHNFYPGALIYTGGKLQKISDPFRRPLDALPTLFSSIGTLKDKSLVAKLRQRLVKSTEEEIFARPETSTMEALIMAGFSSDFIDKFFRPFLGGIFLERNLTTSSHLFEFVLKCFSQGDTALPVLGIGAIAEQLAKKLPEGSMRKKSPVKAVDEGFVLLEDGDTLAARMVVVATPGPEARRLLGTEIEHTRGNSATCVYYCTEKSPPVAEPILVLNGQGNKGIVNNVCVPNLVSASYAPEGHHLISATIIGNKDDDEDHEIDEEVRKELTGWFGEQVHDWRYLKTYRLRYAVPEQLPPLEGQKPVKLRPGIFVCGDHRNTASLNGAMASGRLTAQAIVQEIQAGPE